MKLTIALIILLSVPTEMLNNDLDRIGISGPITFNSTEFQLRWSDKPNDNYYIQEYLPLEETLEHFNQMVTYHLFITDLSPEEAVTQKAKELELRKESDEVCRYSVLNNPDKTEYVIDFVLSDNKDKDNFIVEFNAYRYKRVKINKKTSGLLVFAYTKRGYNDGAITLLSDLKTKRTEHLNEVISLQYPSIKLK